MTNDAINLSIRTGILGFKRARLFKNDYFDCKDLLILNYWQSRLINTYIVRIVSDSRFRALSTIS